MLDLDAWLGRTFPCSCGRTHRLDTRRVVLSAGALEAVPGVLAEVLPGVRRVAVVADRTTLEVAGRRVIELLDRSGLSVGLHLLREAAGHPPVADGGEVARAEAALSPSGNCAGAGGVVAVGSGTVNDVAKLAAFRTGRSYVTVPTAASMNGYTSAIAAILEGGMKRTVPCRGPVAVVADLDVLAAAPLSMTRAGLGDLLSKPVSGSDWLLGHVLRGEYHCAVPGAMVERAERACLQEAGAIGRGEPEAVRVLAEALLLSGLSMAVAGSSSPASGGEHLISHLLDMRAHAEGRPVNLHGAQVGVATLITATLYRHLLDLSPLEVETSVRRATHPSVLARRTWAAEETRLRRAFGPLAATVLPEAMAKWLEGEDQVRHLSGLASRWREVVATLGPGLRPPGAIRETLTAARASTTAAHLGLTAEELRSAFLLARHVRSRYTVLDLAADLCLLDDLADPVLAEAGVLEG